MTMRDGTVWLEGIYFANTQHLGWCAIDTHGAPLPKLQHALSAIFADRKRIVELEAELAEVKQQVRDYQAQLQAAAETAVADQERRVAAEQKAASNALDRASINVQMLDTFETARGDFLRAREVIAAIAAARGEG